MATRTKGTLATGKAVDPMMPMMETCGEHGWTLFVWSFNAEIQGEKLLHCVACWVESDIKDVHDPDLSHFFTPIP